MEVLDYHKLKIFKTVADLKSFSKAANVLFLSQPTVTLQIKKIENYLGITLFNRKKSNLELTEDGKILYEYANKIIDNYIDMEEHLKNLKSKEKTILVAASSTIGDYLLPYIISAFNKKYSDINIKLFIGNSKEVEEGVLSKVFNIGLVEDDIFSNKLDVEPFYKDEIVLISSINNPISSFLESVEELKNYSFIFREIGSGTRNIVEKRLKLKLKPVMEISSSRSIAKIVENSNFLAFVSKLVAEDLFKCNLIKEIKVKDLEINRNFSVITQKNIRLTADYRNFYTFLKTIKY